MAGFYELKKSANAQFHFVLKAGNGEVILSSEQYNSKDAALGGIASVQKNGISDTHYEKKTAKNGSPFFNLKASNGQIIGSSEMYKSEAARDKGIASVKNNVTSATIKDLTS